MFIRATSRTLLLLLSISMTIIWKTSPGSKKWFVCLFLRKKSGYQESMLIFFVENTQKIILTMSVWSSKSRYLGKLWDGWLIKYPSYLKKYLTRKTIVITRWYFRLLTANNHIRAWGVIRLTLLNPCQLEFVINYGNIVIMDKGLGMSYFLLTG